MTSLLENITGLDGQGRIRRMAILLHDSTIEVRAILSEQLTPGSIANLGRINEVEHQLAGVLISRGDEKRYSAERLVALMTDYHDNGLINWEHFRSRAFTKDSNG